MKKKMVLLMTVGMMMLTGCGAEDAASGKTDVATDETAKTSETANTSEAGTEIPSGFAGTEAAPGEINAGNKDSSVEGYRINEPDEKQYTWQEITLTMPEEWVGRCVMEESEYGFSIYQKASYEKDDSSGCVNRCRS